MPPFWMSIALLSIAQGALVAVPRAPAIPRLARLNARRWAAIPAASVIGFVFIARAAERASAQGLTYLALGAVPVLAALALGWLSRGARPARALLVLPLFALAWADRSGLAGEGAGLVLSALSCVALAMLLAAVTPPGWLAAGIVAMALADTALVVSDLLQRPNDVLNAAHPAAGLPRLQSAAFGRAVMGYGDLFVAAVLGALLAGTEGRSLQLRAARLAAVLALVFDLMFFVVNELPATIPVALTLILLVLARRPGWLRSPRPLTRGASDRHPRRHRPRPPTAPAAPPGAPAGAGSARTPAGP
jgi:drug/metabolite transporter superfamily protein YnfA